MLSGPASGVLTMLVEVVNLSKTCQTRPCGIEEVCVHRSIRTDNGLLVALANVVRITEDRGPVERETSESIIGMKIQPGLRSRCKDDFLQGYGRLEKTLWY